MDLSSGNHRNVRLLLVEDDRVDQMAFSRMMREQQPGYTIRIAGSLAEAREVLGRESVDIVICDFYLGDGTSSDILPQLKERGIPVIVVSGAGDEESAAGMVRLGAVDYIIKDQNYNYLKALPLTIERTLGETMLHDDSGHGSAAGSPGPAGADTFPGCPDIPFRRLLVDPSELIARYRPDGTILYVNDSYCHYFGKSRSELIGQQAEPFLPDDERDALAGRRSRLDAANPAATAEYRVLSATGEPRWIRRTDRALFDDRGTLIEFQMVATDITEKKLAEEALRESEERYRMLAEHAFDGILIQDPDGTILSVNQSIVKMFGFIDPAEVIGKNSLSFLAEESRETAINDLRNVLEGKQGYVSKYHAVRPDGTVIILESVGTLIPFQGKAANIVALRDVTEREMAGLRLRRELERKRDFINVAAHELRTPLQPVIGYLDLLLDGQSGYGIPEDARGVLQKVRTYVESERHMVNQILELSLLESVHAQQFPLDTGPVDLRELAGIAIRHGNYDAGAAIAVTIPPGTVITSNGPYIHEILDALLSNAVNYSRPPREIAVSAEETEADVKISVTDNGVGIPPEKLEIIFDPFYISDADKLSRKYGRLGVGLTMARNRAARIGGSIRVASTLGTGSTFTLVLPKRPENPG